MSSAIKALFDEKGDCPSLGDPYRELTPTAKLLFSEDGYLTVDTVRALHEIIAQRPVDPMCDAVRMLVADEFAGNTKGNYSTIYLWR